LQTDPASLFLSCSLAAWISGPVAALRPSGPMGFSELLLVRVSELSKFGVGPRHMGIPAFWYWWVVVAQWRRSLVEWPGLGEGFPEMPNSQSLLEAYGSSEP
jgi:hypothetical protein